MKTKRTLLIVALFGAAQAVAAGQPIHATSAADATNAAPATAISLTAPNHQPTQAAAHKIEPGYSAPQYLLVEPKLSTKSGQETDQGIIRRWDGESSQPWITIAGRQQNLTALHDAGAREPEFSLIWFGSRPGK